MNGKTLTRVGMTAGVVVALGGAISVIKEYRWWAWRAEAQDIGAVAYETKLKILFDRLDGNLDRKDRCIVTEENCTAIRQRVRDIEREIEKTVEAMNKLK